MQGGWNANDYGSFVNEGNKERDKFDGSKLGPADPDGRRFVVQMVAPYTGSGNCGVNQTIRVKSANKQLLSTIAWNFNIMGQGLKRPGSPLDPKVEMAVLQTVINEVLLDPANPFNLNEWVPLYSEGYMSFVDVPLGAPGDKGELEFETCFFSKDPKCARQKCCIKWTWTMDFTNNNKINKVTPGKTSC